MDSFRGFYRINPDLIKENWRMSTYNRLDLQALGSQPVMPKNLPGHWMGGSIYPCIGIVGCMRIPYQRTRVKVPSKNAALWGSHVTCLWGLSDDLHIISLLVVDALHRPCLWLASATLPPFRSMSRMNRRLVVDEHVEFEKQPRHEIYRSFLRNLLNICQMNEAKPEDVNV